MQTEFCISGMVATLLCTAILGLAALSVGLVCVARAYRQEKHKLEEFVSIFVHKGTIDFEFIRLAWQLNKLNEYELGFKRVNLKECGINIDDPPNWGTLGPYILKREREFQKAQELARHFKFDVLPGFIDYLNPAVKLPSLYKIN